MKSRLVLWIAIAMLPACNNEPPTPKPRAYPRVEYPDRTFTSFREPECPFGFEYPGYAKIEKKPNEKHDCWFDLVMPSLKARVHCSYIAVKDRAEFDDLVRDSYTIASKINARANFMEDNLIRTKQGIAGLIFKWTGPAASPMHFILTDTTTHFFKGALYFETEVKPDSLAPISAFIEEDINKMIQSFTWKQ